MNLLNSILVVPNTNGLSNRKWMNALEHNTIKTPLLVQVGISNSDVAIRVHFANNSNGANGLFKEFR